MLRVFFLFSMALPCLLWAQNPPATQSTQSPDGPELAAQRLRPTYVLQAGDQIQIRALDIEEIGDRPLRIDDNGMIQLPFPQTQPIQAAGKTVEQLEAAIKTELGRFFREPQVSVTVISYRLPPIFMVGAFRNPGIKPLQPRSTLLEVLTREGGVAANAGKRIRVTRRNESGPIPLKTAQVSKDGRSSYVEINIEQFQSVLNSEEDITIQPFDIISIERAEQVYFLGGVGRPGPIDFGDRKSLSILQALSLAGGLSPDAQRGKAVLLRPIGNTAERAQLPLALKEILAGQSNDFPLQPNDIIYIPAPGVNSLSRLLPQIASGGLTAIVTTLAFRAF